MERIAIAIKDSDLWGFGVPVTTQRLDKASECCGAQVNKFGYCEDCKEHADPNNEVVWCNHAGAREEDYEQTFHNPYGADTTSFITILKCDKCEAWKRADEDFWSEAPFEGVSYE